MSFSRESAVQRTAKQDLAQRRIKVEESEIRIAPMSDDEISDSTPGASVWQQKRSAQMISSVWKINSRADSKVMRIVPVNISLNCADLTEQITL